jgi:hypothetical protein
MANSVSLTFYIGPIFLMGALSDQFGRTTAQVTALILFMGLAVPKFCSRTAPRRQGSSRPRLSSARS